MALPYYNPSIPAPARAHFFGGYDEVYGYGPQPIFPPDTGDDLASKTQVPVNKSRSRKFWNAVWAKPKHWWSTRSPTQKKTWLYVLALMISGTFIALVTATVHVGVSFGAGDRWGVSEYHHKRSDVVMQHRQEVTGPRDIFISGAAWPTETRNTGILTTQAASPAIVAVPFTA